MWDFKTWFREAILASIMATALKMQLSTKGLTLTDTHTHTHHVREKSMIRFKTNASQRGFFFFLPTKSSEAKISLPMRNQMVIWSHIVNLKLTQLPRNHCHHLIYRKQDLPCLPRGTVDYQGSKNKNKISRIALAHRIRLSASVICTISWVLHTLLALTETSKFLISIILRTWKTRKLCQLRTLISLFWKCSQLTIC